MNKSSRHKNLFLKTGLALFGIVSIMMSLVANMNYKRELQREVAASVLRLHVRANSNSESDQAMKLIVRDMVLEKFETYKDEMNGKAAAVKCVQSHMKEITDDVNKSLRDQYGDVRIKMYYGTEWFPQKSYGDISLPEGDYQALIVNVGKGEGENWWCILFPRLCFVSDECGIVPEEEKNELRQNISSEAWDYLTKDKIEFKFKVTEWMKFIDK